jgi:uncharacterized protein (DUF58 family)
VVALTPLPPASGQDSASQAERPALHTPQGEDFFTLREYQVGDDLRKVHWRSTARRGRLMIKQEQIPWHARGTVVLDVRDSAVGPTGGVAFEASVVAAASAVQHLAQRGEFCRFVATDSTELAFGFGLDHFRTILDCLAVIEDTRTDHFASTISNLHRGESTGGALIFCGGLLSEDEARRLVALRPRYTPMVAVRHPPSAAAGALGRVREVERENRIDDVLRSGAVLVVRPGPEGLGPAWESVLGIARRTQGMRRLHLGPSASGSRR